MTDNGLGNIPHWGRCAAAGLLLTAGLWAQAPDDSHAAEAPIRVSAQEVVVDVVVHDRHGKMVRNLDPKDVALFEDGVQQEIRSLRLISTQSRQSQPAPTKAGKKAQPASPAPASPLETMNLVCLVFHDLTPESRKRAFEAGLDFIAAESGPNTIIGIFSLSDSGVHPMARFTRNRAELVAALQRGAAGGASAASSSQQLFTAMGQEMTLSINLPSGPASEVGGQSTPQVDFASLGTAVDASVETGTGGAIARNPLGRQEIDYERVAGMREMDAFGWLIAQLSRLPFRKTVLLFSPGVNRPSTEMDHWDRMIKAANAASISFYAVELREDTTASPLAASRAGTQRAAGLSQAQGKPDPIVNGLAAEMARAHQTDLADYAVSTANTHASLVDLVEGTGGLLITDTSKKMLARVMDDAETRFELSYRAAAETFDGSFHRIEVRLARPDLRVEARNGYYAVPQKPGGGALSPDELAGLRALNSKPQPHDVEYRSQALRFRAPDGRPEFAIALEVPMAKLTATAEAAAKSERLHVSLLALVKDSTGRIVDILSTDSPIVVPDAERSSLATGRVQFARPVVLDPGHYTVETAVVDWEAGRSGTSTYAIDAPQQAGPELSTLTLVRRIEDVDAAAAASDPLVSQGKQAIPSLATDLEAGSKPYIFFRVYPDKTAGGRPSLKAQILLDGRLAASQSSELPAPDASGSIPVTIAADARPGSHELRLAVTQGGRSSQQSVKYTVSPK